MHSALRDRRPSECQAALPALLDDATALLRDALDLMAELGAVNADTDLSYLQRPSCGSLRTVIRRRNCWVIRTDLHTSSRRSELLDTDVTDAAKAVSGVHV